MLRFKNFWPFSRKASIDDIMRDLYGGREVRSGAKVTTVSALEVAAVFRCVKILSDTLSTIPLRIFQKKGTNNREPAVDHELYDLFDVAPNAFQDTLQFREWLSFSLILNGNAFVFINRVRGRIVELVPLMTNKISVEQNQDLSLVYTLSKEDGTTVVFPQEAIWHVRGPTMNGWMGLEAVALAREAVGLAMAMEHSQARLQKNGLRPSGVYSVEGILKDSQAKQLREYLDSEFTGIDNSGKPMLLDRAAKFTSLAMKSVDAQQLEGRKFQVEEICRAFGVLPIMAGHSENNATYASAEQMFLAHSVHTSRPLHRRLEASIKFALISKEDRKRGIYAKFLDAELLRGAAKDRAEYYRSGINAGWLMRNEARRFEELNPIDGLDEPLSPMNMVVGNPLPAEEGAKPPPEPIDPKE